jgi:hypothetical protein
MGERDVIAELRELSRDVSQPENVRREAAEALRNHERLSGNERKEPT